MGQPPKKVEILENGEYRIFCPDREGATKLLEKNGTAIQGQNRIFRAVMCNANFTAEQIFQHIGEKLLIAESTEMYFVNRPPGARARGVKGAKGGVEDEIFGKKNDSPKPPPQPQKNSSNQNGGKGQKGKGGQKGGGNVQSSQPQQGVNSPPPPQPQASGWVANSFVPRGTWGSQYPPPQGNFPAGGPPRDEGSPQGGKGAGSRECFNCGGKGHFARSCPSPPNGYGKGGNGKGKGGGKAWGGYDNPHQRQQPYAPTPSAPPMEIQASSSNAPPNPPGCK